ncbi:MAG TPA: EAL domain-containing protein [Vicinamibacteria bacterium]|nr:EAL domain-containing protein [Vicinamibacteria bacterium]
MATIASGSPLPARLQVLLLEDDPGDRQLIAQEIGRCFEAVELRSVATGRDFERALRERAADVILVDYLVPGYGGAQALQQAARLAPGTPLIVVTGSLDEETAAGVIKAGAADYVLKDRLARLGGAIRTALEARRLREDRERALQALRESEERYALAIRGANDGLWDWDISGGRFYFSARWKAMLGYGEGAVGVRPEDWFDRVHPDDISRLRRALDEHVLGAVPYFECEHRMRTAEGAWRWMLSRGLAVRDAAGRACRMAGSQTDIARRKQAEEQLIHDALHDALTKLPNRTLFVDRLRLALARHRRRPRGALAVCCLNLDRFKVVNDGLGHAVADEVLVAVARRLDGCLRPGDTVARLGGDEFAILLEEVADVGQALRVAERVHLELRAPFRVHGHELFSTATVGIAMAAPCHQQAEELLRDAATALHRGKRRGRGRSEIFDESMHSLAAARLQLETDLWRAVQRRELRLHYQPMVALDTERVTGFEALVRWQHPRRGLLAPEEFVPLAEEMGVSAPLGAWVLQEACRAAGEWQRSFPRAVPLSVSVNLSARQFAQSDVLALAADALAESGLAAASLRLELTESVIMEEPEAAAAKLSRLKDLGIALDIDDFGTGYSSLSHLRRFPIDALKIDRSFVSRMDTELDDHEIVRTIVTLAANLGVAAVAEGVETPEQKSRLQGMRCRFGQGFLFSRPLDLTAVSELLRTRRDGG